jgi:hypothetical protein
MDFDVTALVGPRFRLSAAGLLILHGSAAHPGFGREYDETTRRWVLKDNERLTFIVANVGPGPITLTAGQTIAYLQFFDIEPNTALKEIRNVGFDIYGDMFSDRTGGDQGLSFFRNVKDMEAGLAKLRDAVAEDREANRRSHEVSQTQIDRIANGSNMVVIFGVFLVAVTMLGFVLTILVDAVEKLPDTLGGWHLWVLSILGTSYAATAGLGVFFVWRAVNRITRRR